MTIRSINEPGTTREGMLTPASVNEPPILPEWASEAPVVDSITPPEATIGDPSFDLIVSGTGFYEQSVIVFAGHDEPTTLEADGTLTTGVNMDVWHGPDTVKVSVRNGPIPSNEVDFTFLPAEVPEDEAEQAGKEAYSGLELEDPDELEDEIEQAGEEGDFKPVHRGKRKR